MHTMNWQPKQQYTLSDLEDIMTLLRSENGCPWDREQTHQTIRGDLLEEAYEVADAIDQNSPAMLREELGDLLLQVVFHAELCREAGEFSMAEVCDGICRKLILRHPHVFGEVTVHNTDEVLANWDAIKQVEKQQTSVTDTLYSVPKAFPALLRSQKVQKRAAKGGFDYPDVAMALDHLEQEIAELREAMAVGSADAQREEMGDVLFSAVNVSRFLGISAEESLAASCEKFITRFAIVEALCRERGILMQQESMDRLDALWGEAKQQLAHHKKHEVK